VEGHELLILRVGPSVFLDRRVQVSAPAAHALLVRPPLEVPGDLGPPLTVLLVELGEL
jgi:hypothetical protein